MTTAGRVLALRPHPADRDAAVRGVDVRVLPRSDGGLALGYRVTAPADAVRIPAPQPPGRADELWRHTCFEAFIAVAGEPAYREFNFSPSGRWADYAFRSPRERLADPDRAASASPRLAIGEGGLTLEAVLDAALLPPRGPGARLEIGLATVVEALDGRLAYWALAHPGPRPDFHARAGFVLGLDWAPVTAPHTPPCP